MDESQRSITHSNIERLFSHLIVEPDAERRRTYCDILLTEEDRFAGLHEQLELAHALLRRFDVLIERQKSRIDGEQDGERRRWAETVLQTFVETRRLFELRQTMIYEELEKGRLWGAPHIRPALFDCTTEPSTTPH